jgi:hypothetical protein
VIQHSDILLILADCDALANPETLPRARQATRDITERVGALAPTIPLIFIWAKVDRALKPSIKDSLEINRLQFAPHSTVRETTIKDLDSIAAMFSQGIDLGESQRSHAPQLEPRISSEPFLSFRGYYVGS